MSTLRLAATGDRHIKATRRLSDTEAIMHSFAEHIRDADIDLVFDGGDFFDAKSTAEERNLLRWHLQEIATQCPVYGCKGNHDADRDLDIYEEIRSDNWIEIHDRPRLNDMANRALGGFSLHALPWFDKAHLLRNADPDVTLGEGIDLATQGARSLMQAFRRSAESYRKRGITPLLVSHLMVAGSTTSTGQTLIGQTVEISPSELQALGFELCHLSHIHKRQVWYDGRVAYSGSPERMNFGEPEAKGWNLVTFEDGKFVSNEFVELPARKIELVEVDWTAPDSRMMLDPLESMRADDALVRFRYRVRPEQLHEVDEDKLRKILSDAGAHDVKIEAVLVHQDRVRCEEIALATTTWDKLLAYYASKGIEINDATAERLQSKLATVETPASEEVAA